MQISLDEAIDIHVRVLQSRYGRGAVESSQRRATICKRLGDFEGEKVWLRVAEAVERRIEEVEARRGH